MKREIKAKLCILVEWYNHLEESDYYSTTYELFEDINKAFEFAKKVKVRQIDLVKANNWYYEEDGTLNYEDNALTIQESVLSQEVKINKYEEGFDILMEYFDSIADEEKPKVDKALKKLGL